MCLLFSSFGYYSCVNASISNSGFVFGPVTVSVQRPHTYRN